MTKTGICVHIPQRPEKAKYLQLGSGPSSFPSSLAWTLPHWRPLSHGRTLTLEKGLEVCLESFSEFSIF